MSQTLTVRGLPPDAVAELAGALRTLRGGAMAGVLGAMRSVAGLAPAPLLRRLAAGAAAVRPLAEAALARAFDVAVIGLGDRPSTGVRAHLAAAASGAAGGAAGLAGALPDAAFTTLLIMREIAAIARAEGENLADDAARRACLEVFALGGADGEGYFATRLLFAGAPLAGLLQRAAATWGTALAQKMVAGAVPLAGAAAGMAINTAFLAHLRGLARAHFTVRRLERVHGADLVRDAAATLGEPAHS